MSSLTFDMSFENNKSTPVKRYEIHEIYVIGQLLWFITTSSLLLIIQIGFF